MRIRFYFRVIVAGCFLLLLSQSAQAQFTPVDQSRYLSTSAVGTGPNQQFSNTVTTGGGFNDSESAAKDYTDPTDITPDGPANFHAHGTASQNSFVTSASFSGIGSAYADAIQLAPSQGYSVEGNGQSGYTVDFTVPTETFFMISGDLTASGSYHPVSRAEILDASLVLSGSAAGTLYSVGGIFTAPVNGGQFTDNVPISFGSLLEPGQTYTLTALATADSLRTDLSGKAPGSTSFNFVATVPEPASIGALIVAGAYLLGRRRV